MESKTLKDIRVDDISPNPHNPRLVFDQKELDELKGSICKVGVLVPLTVYENRNKYPNTSYILLDGERRWRCAKELSMDTIPANVIDEPKDVTQNILFMFNIHHYRTEWALFPTALKLEILIRELETDTESVLERFTGVNKSMIRRCKALLWYPPKYRDLLMEKGGKVIPDLFIELHPIARRLSYEDEYSYPDGISNFVDSCIEKFKSKKIIDDVKEFREIRKSLAYYDKKGEFHEFKRIIRQFMENDIGVEVFATSDIEDERTRKNITKYISYLNAIFKEINPDLISDTYFVDQLIVLRERISSLLEEID